MKLLIVILTSTAAAISFSAQASGHRFTCAFLSSPPNHQVTVELSDEEARASTVEKRASITVSEMQAGEDHARWVETLELTDIPVRLNWDTQNNQNVITSVDFDQPEFGVLSMGIRSDFNEHFFAPGYWRSTLETLPYPTGAMLDYCSYRPPGGARPGVTGSN